MDGLLLVDKPSGWTSHDVVGYIRKALGVKRVGHTGTLDPDATGLLIILVGKATRLAKYHEGDAKSYRASMRLGSETDTEDAGGSVTKECPVPELGEKTVIDVFERFTGEIEQTPPMYSAVKVCGTPLYKAARKGEEVERKPRRVVIHSLGLVGMDGDTVTFDVTCSKGTYIRTLCREMGTAFGSCAHMASLRRTGAGVYEVGGALDIESRPDRGAFENALVPLGVMLGHLPAVVLASDAAMRVRDGVRPRAGDISRTEGEPCRDGHVRVMGPAGELLAVGRYTAEEDPAVVLETVVPA